MNYWEIVKFKSVTVICKKNLNSLNQSTKNLQNLYTHILDDEERFFMETNI